MMANPNASSGAMDWQSLKQRLARAQAAMAAAERLSPEQARAVMDQRARQLAQPPKPPVDSNQILEVMLFRLAAARMGLETRFICEVYRPSGITPVPGSPDFLVGVTNLRGGVLAVMDLHGFFGGTVAETHARSQVVVVGQERPEFGILVDEVYEVVRLHVGDVLEPSGSVSGMGADCLRGVTKDALLVLDGDSLLADERLFVNEGT
jgi:purine-binding chemotaxis protein CheW